MKGLALAEAYFTEYGMPLLRKFTPYADRIAAGIVGPGSECFGFDDELSRDHDWGPGFCLWLDDVDYDKIGPDLQREYDAMPKVCQGFGPREISPGEEHRTGVCRITEFYRRYTGLDRPPETEEEWRRIPESNLALCTNGKVFRDPAGAFTAWREQLLAHYPETLRRKKIARFTFLTGQSGQYNLWRAKQREALFQTCWAVMRFCTDILRLLFLLNRRFAPFDKWLFSAARDLPVLGAELTGLCRALLVETTRTGSGENNSDEEQRIIQEAARLVIGELRSQGLSSSKSAYLIDHSSEIVEHSNPSGKQGAV
jgi:hypothetical protein